MRAINHALTGAAIGLSVANPMVAGVAALVSHFICDAIPHFGLGQNYIKTKGFRNLLVVDTLLCVWLVVLLFIVHPWNWLSAAMCAFIATAPDLLWFGKYRSRLKNRQQKPNLFMRFAKNIQWFERPSGAVVEVVWFVGFASILASLLYA